MNVLTRTGDCIRLTQQEAKAMRLIRENSCNYYLNFSSEIVPLDIWHTIENLILAGKVYPSVITIDIRKSNLSIDDIHSELRNMIIS